MARLEGGALVVEETDIISDNSSFQGKEKWDHINLQLNNMGALSKNADEGSAIPVQKNPKYSLPLSESDEWENVIDESSSPLKPHRPRLLPRMPPNVGKLVKHASKDEHYIIFQKEEIKPLRRRSLLSSMIQELEAKQNVIDNSLIRQEFVRKEFPKSVCRGILREREKNGKRSNYGFEVSGGKELV
jgi:hypothetical protein